MAVEEAPQAWEAGFMTAEQKIVTGNLIRLRTTVKQDAIRTVHRLHRNLGHPGPTELAELLATRGASEEVIEAARNYVCSACAKYKKPGDAAPAAMPQTATFNQILQADVFWIRMGKDKYPVLSVVDMATRYTSAHLLRNEQSEEYIKALERCWLSTFGLPQRLITDEGRPWLSRIFEGWSTAHGIFHEVAPGEAHERLAVVERRHALLRKAVEIYCSDQHCNNAKGIKEALVYCVPQLNGSNTVAGFSPAQWVLGYQPQLAGSLLADNFKPAHFGGHEDFELTLARRSAAQKAMIEADADKRLRRALGAKYKGLNSEYSLGQQAWFWRDARQPDLVKIRWLGPAHVVMKEHKKDGEGQDRVHVYWLAYKTQLIRCAPHHVRADIKGSQHALDDVQSALTTVRQLKSRGVTRYYDLHQLNKSNLVDVDSDAHMDDPAGDLIEDESDHELSPPRQRPRLLPPDTEATPEPTRGVPPADAPQQLHELPMVDLEDYTPTSRADGSPQASAPGPFEMMPAAPTTPQPEGPAAPPPLPRVPGSIASISEPSEEPPARTAPQTPVDAQSPNQQGANRSAPPQSTPALDSITAELYEPAVGESFEQRRLRLNRQETISFAPLRHRTRAEVTPYPVPETVPTPPSTDDLAGQAFHVDDIDTKMLPSGWTMDEHGYLQLTDRTTDFWEIRAGCLIRHHVMPRRGRLHIDHLPKDCPIEHDQLDRIRVTVVHQSNGTSRLCTDDGADSSAPPNVTSSWTGATIFQINGSTRKEMAMYSGQGRQHCTSARQQGKEQKLARQKKFKKDKNGVNERLLGPHERAMFKEAKVKELKSFFDHHVWVFDATKEADPARTLTSRILLKWSKNPDGSPRAKARLIVRGFADPDALAGQVETSSPTTTGCRDLWCSPWPPP